jgi:hypothetical protein
VAGIEPLDFSRLNHDMRQGNSRMIDDDFLKG